MQLTRHRLALEDMEPKHWIAGVLGLPGRYSDTSTPTGAVTQSAERIAGFYAW